LINTAAYVVLNKIEAGRCSITPLIWPHLGQSYTKKNKHICDVIIELFISFRDYFAKKGETNEKWVQWG
jgi:hypothetical protein